MNPQRQFPVPIPDTPRPPPSPLPAATLQAFVKAWCRDPAGIGALVPSGPVLAAAMARQVLHVREGTIIELGPGSGPITAALIEFGVPLHRLYLVEKSPSLAAFLRHRFAGIRIAEGDARRLKSLVHRDGIEKVSSVISSLPLRNLDCKARYAIIKQSVDLLHPSGVFVQFTYSHLSPLPRALAQRLGLEVECAGYVWRNVPPASIWIFRLRAEQRRGSRPIPP